MLLVLVLCMFSVDHMSLMIMNTTAMLPDYVYALNCSEASPQSPRASNYNSTALAVISRWLIAR